MVARTGARTPAGRTCFTLFIPEKLPAGWLHLASLWKKRRQEAADTMAH